MDLQETFRRLVTNQYIPELEYHTHELKFQTVFKVSPFSYQCCPCGVEHEYVTYITNEGTINEEVYDRILRCIVDGKCPHVKTCTENALVESKVYASHIAAASNTFPAFKSIYQREAFLYTSLFYQIPYMIALLKENLEIVSLLQTITKFDERSSAIMCFYIRSPEKPFTFKFKLMSFLEMCVTQRNKHLLKWFYEVMQISDCTPVELTSLIFWQNLTDMRKVILGDNWQHAAIDFVDTTCGWCEVAFLYNDHLILEGILSELDKTQLQYHKNGTTKKLKELSSLLKRESCASIISKYCITLPTNWEITSSSIVLTLLGAIVNSHDPNIHHEIVDALRTQNIIKSVNVKCVYEKVLQDIFIGKTDVLRAILDLGVNINLTTKGKTLLDESLIKSLPDSILSQRMAVEMILYENPDVQVHSTTTVTALQLDIDELLSTEKRRWRLPYDINYCMDAIEHGLFGHDGTTLALNFYGHLLVECGFELPSKTRELLEATNRYRKLHPDILERIIPSYRDDRDIPRSLQLLCRDSLRRHYKGRQIHAFVNGRNVPSGIRDFLLLKPNLKTIQHMLDG